MNTDAAAFTPGGGGFVPSAGAAEFKADAAEFVPSSAAAEFKPTTAAPAFVPAATAAAFVPAAAAAEFVPALAAAAKAFVPASAFVPSQPSQQQQQQQQQLGLQATAVEFVMGGAAATSTIAPATVGGAALADDGGGGGGGDDAGAAAVALENHNPYAPAHTFDDDDDDAAASSEFVGQGGATAGGWAQRGAVLAVNYQGVAATAVKFDPLEELVWTGGQDGYVASFFASDLQRYVNFPAHPQPIISVFPSMNGITSVSGAGIRFHSRGGALRSASDPLQLQAVRSALAPDPLGSSFVLGTADSLAVFDIATNQLVESYGAANGATAMCCKSRVTFIGGLDGMVEARDSR
jgi:hypothetical protein